MAAANLKKRGDISGYVHSISQMKTSKTSHVQYFSALIQTREKTWHVSSYSHEKHEHLMGFQAVQQAVKITNAAFVPSKRRVETLDVFIDKRSELESTSVDFPFTNTAAESGSDEYTNLSDVLKMQHRDKVSVCVKILSEETSDDVTLDDGTVTKRAIFRVADGSLSTQGQQVINVSIYGKNMIKKIRNMPIARLKNMVVHVSEGQVSLSTHDNSSITSRKEEERCSGLASCNCSNCKDPEVSSQMPCWYFEKDDLQFTSSFFDGVDPDTEARYRREGARFILDTGTKMGLKFDSCATGVVYFHRFYMIHSFREFNRYVTGACCLFLAGKVEETPKKCKDIIKATREMLSESQFSAFGDDPKEEVMTLERILLQTIKFDLRVEHPYSYILKYAKQIKGDKDKVQKLIQMAWTFINDSMCTTLCLQWESDMIAVALMYLAGRLTKHEITDWHGKQPGTKKKWWDSFVEDATMDLLEDICHQVLDLYSAPVVKRESSPPLPRHDPQVMMAAIKQRELQMQQAKQQEQMQQQTQQQQLHQKRAPEKGKKDSSKKAKTAAVASHAGQSAVKTELLQAGASQSGAAVAAVAAYAYPPPNQNFMSAQNESSSFMSGEGAQSLRSLMGSYPASTASTADAQYSYPQYGQYTYPQYTQAQSAAHATQSYAHAQTDPANAQYYPYYQQQQQQQQQQQGHQQQQYAQQYGQQYYTQAAQAGAYAPNSAHTVTYAQTPQYPQTTYAATTLAYAPATYAQAGHYTQATTNQAPYTTNHYTGQ